MNATRRALVLATACSALLPRLAAAGVRRRLALVGYAAMFDGPDGMGGLLPILAKLGLVDGRQIDVVRVVVPPRAESDPRSGLDYLVPQLERLVPAARPDVIVVLGSAMTLGVRRVTRTIPIVTTVGDPIDLGLAESIARPGGNVTGLAGGMAEAALKSMEILKRIVPRLSRVAICQAVPPYQALVRLGVQLERAARSAGLEPVAIPGRSTENFVAGVRALAPGRVQAVAMAFWPDEKESAVFLREAHSRRLPVLATDEHDVERGALASYVASDNDAIERLAPVVAEILRGADPAAFPFQLPRTYRLAVNRRAAASLGLEVPADVLVRADRVIG